MCRQRDRRIGRRWLQHDLQLAQHGVVALLNLQYIESLLTQHMACVPFSCYATCAGKETVTLADGAYNVTGSLCGCLAQFAEDPTNATCNACAKGFNLATCACKVRAWVPMQHQL